MGRTGFFLLGWLEYFYHPVLTFQNLYSRVKIIPNSVMGGSTYSKKIIYSVWLDNPLRNTLPLNMIRHNAISDVSDPLTIFVHFPWKMFLLFFVGYFPISCEPYAGYCYFSLEFSWWLFHVVFQVIITCTLYCNCNSLFLLFHTIYFWSLHTL